MKLPFVKFFPNDWLAEPSLRACSLAARGLWIDMLSLMHLAPRRGYLLAATGSPHTPEQLARLTGCSADELTRLLGELRTSGAFSCTDDGVIFSRRMVREESKRQLCSEAGRRGGGNPTFKGGAKGAPKGHPKGVPKPLEARGQTPEARSESPPNPPRPGGTAHAASTPRARRRKEPPGDDPHARAVRAFCDAWRKRYGARHPFDAGTDGAAVADVLDRLGGDPAAFAAVIGRYLADGEGYLVNARHPPALLRAQLARWLVPGPGSPAPQAPPGRNPLLDGTYRFEPRGPKAP